MSRLKLKFYDGKNGDDGERAVLPALIFCQRKFDGLTGNVLAIGWWKWHIGIQVITGCAALTAKKEG